MKKAIRKSMLGMCFCILSFTASSISALTLNEAIQLALDNNLTIKAQSINVALGTEGINIAEGQNAPSFFSSVNYEDLSRRQNAIEFTSTGELNLDRIFEEDNLRSAAGVRYRTIYGTQIEAGVQASRLENTITRSGGASIFDPEYQSTVSLSVIQPLLKNFSTDSNLIEQNLASIEAKRSEAEYDLVLTNQMIELLNVFYDCLFGQENLAAKLQSVETANALLESNKSRQSAGQMSPIDVSIAEVRVSEAQEEAWLAESFLNDSKSALLKLLGISDTSLDFEVEGEITAQSPRLDMQELIASALSNRPDIQLAIAAVEEEEARSRYTKDQARPELNLNLSYGLNGLNESVDSSLERALENREADFRVGISFEMPLSDRSATASVRAAAYSVERANIQLTQLKSSISIDVQNSVKRLQSILQRIQATERSLIVAEQALAAEQKRLDNGQSTTFDVIQLQETMSSAHTRVLASQVDAIKALNQIYAVTGQLPELHQFSVPSSR